MNKIKITNHQLFALTACFTCGSSAIAISASVAALAKNDSWISSILSTLFGLLVLWMLCILWRNNKGMTFIEILKSIFGKYLGTAVSIYFIFFCLIADSQIVYYIGQFMTTEVTTETPSFVINAVFIIVIVIALLYGIETIARSYEILFYFVSFLFASFMILVLPNVKIKNLEPVFEGGVVPVLKGSLLLSSFLIFPFIILLMILPKNANNTKEARKSFINGYLWGSAIIFISTLFSILVLGSEITSSCQFPVYMLGKEINIGTILTRLEFVTAAVWFTTILLRGIFYFYAALVGLVQLLKINDYKKLIIPLGFIIVVMSEVVYPDVIYKSQWDTFTWVPFAATFGLILPILMIIVSKIKELYLKWR